MEIQPSFPFSNLYAMPEEIQALRTTYELSTQAGTWYAEASLAHPKIIVTDGSLRSMIARFDEHALCVEHGGSAFANALFVARAHQSMPFLLACMEIAEAVARGEINLDVLQTKASRLFEPSPVSPSVETSAQGRSDGHSDQHPLLDADASGQGRRQCEKSR